MSWRHLSLKDISKVIAGQSPEGKYYNNDGIGLPFYQGKKNFTKKYLGKPEKWTKKVTKEAIKGDILMSVRAPVGPVNIATEKVCIGRGLASIRVNKNIDLNYVYNYLVLNESKINGNEGAVFNSINKKQIESISIPIPPLPEQKQIVEILDKAFEKIDKAIANIERNIENAEELFQSKLNSYFLDETNYKEVKIIETCDDKSQIVGGPFGSNLKVKDYIDSGIPILRLQNIGKGYFINKSIKYISHKKAEELKYHSFKKGDIVLAKLGIPIGKTCIVPESFENGIVVADVVRIRPNVDLVNYSFLKNFLNSDSAVNQLSSEIRGSTRPRVNISEVRNLKLRLPPLNIQLKINKEIEELNDLKTKQIKTYNKMLESLDELKKSILEKAFKGELTSAA